MKKILVISICFILLSTSFLSIKAGTSDQITIACESKDTNLESNNENGEASFEIKESVQCSEPEILVHDHQNAILLQEANTYLHNPGQPILPVIINTYMLPIGSTLTHICCLPQGIQEQLIDHDIICADKLFPPSTLNINVNTMRDSAVANHESLYPSTWYEYSIGVGLNGEEHVTYVTMQLYPIRYNPMEHEMVYANTMEITIQYDTPKTPIRYPDEYDLVIIAPFKFSSSLQPLVEHKERMNVKTKLVTTEEIYRDYEGRDDQEKIKYFIKDAIESFGISYVLLFGGMKGINMFSWHVPVRYSWLSDGGESKHISDLYYSDIYKYDSTAGFTFDDWDSNGNNVLAEWYAFISTETPYTRSIVDILDLYPDVYVGRLPVRTTVEAKTIVDKIITYESTTAGAAWFDTIVVLGGDNANESLWIENPTDYYEGELMTNQTLSYMDGFTHIRLWPEGGDVTLTPENAEAILSEGEGFVHFVGHGTPYAWETHPHGDEDTWIEFTEHNIKNLKNEHKLPIVIVSGCHNCQFDTSPLRFLTDGIQAFSEYVFVSKCWGWSFASQQNGGSIASIGHTGLSYYGAGDGHLFEDRPYDGLPDCIQYFDGWLEPHFFKVYNHDGRDVLGETHGQTLTDYLNQFPIEWDIPLGDLEQQATMYDCKTVQEWVLLGDPSLKIGGYP